MKIFYKNAAFVLVMLLSTVSLFGQSLPLIFQITDPDNAPLPSVEIKITSQNEEYDITQITDELGRIVISSFLPGDYKYEVNYGDYSIGSFSIAPGAPFAWIDLDFRKAAITLRDNNDNPLVDDEVNMYKTLPNGSDSLISTKKTDTDGVAEFILLDKEKYSYMALLQKEAFTMNGGLKKDVSAQSAYALVSIYFGFKIDNEIIDVAAGNITVYRKNDAGQYMILHGESPAKAGPNNAGYHLFDSPVSCKPGVEYQAKVMTTKYGLLTTEFIPYFNPAMSDTVYFSFETKPGGGGGTGGGGGGGGGKPPFPPEWVEDEVVVIIVNTVWKDTEEPVPYTPYIINHFEYKTNKNAADTVWVYKDSDCTVESAFGNHSESFIATQDTTIITLYYDDFYRVAFTYRLDGEVVYPSGISNFRINSTSINHRSSTLLGQGNYTYSFSINDFNYNGAMSGAFDIPEITKATRGKDTTIYIDIVKKKEVKFILLDPEDQPLPFYSAEIFKYENGALLPDTQFDLAAHTGFVTNEEGTFTDYLLIGDYQAAVLDSLFNFSIQSDTTIILQRKAAMKNVYFKFLLDGKEVFPQVKQIDLSFPDKTNSFYIVSSFKQDEEGNEYSFFDKPAKCLPGEYVYNFLLTDMGFNGRKYGSFQTVLSAQQDTIVFIVLPIKPEVEITVLDKNRVPVKNVYGTIYKYNEDGTLNPDPFYDDFSHDMLKTSDNGVIWDRLMPGKYRYVMEDIVQRDFVVGEYDIKFQVISGVDYYTTTFIVKDTKGNPVTNTLLEIRQEGDFYGSNLTDKNGEMKIENEAGTYTYHLDYGNVEAGTYHIVKSDTTIYIIVEELVNAESIAVKGCQCLQNGESIQLFPKITPENATFSDVHWSIDNQLYANVSSKGILTANEVGLAGTVIVTATAKDGSGVFGTKEVKIKQNCNDAKIALSIGKPGVKDTTVAGGTLPLIAGEISGEILNPVEWFIYQYSTDETTWSNLNTEPTQEISFSLNAANYASSETNYFRIIAAESAEVALKVSEEDFSETCATYLVSTTVQLNVIDIFQDWADYVCSSNAEVMLNLSKESLAIIEQAGTVVEWHKKTDEATGFIKTTVPQDKQLNPTFALTGKTTFKVRIVNEAENFAIEFEQAIDYISVSGFKINASETTVCKGASVELSLNNADYPAGSYKWFDESEQPTVTVLAERKEYWAILNACPKDTAKISLIIDEPLKISLKADKELICSTETNKIELRTEITQGEAGTFSWSPNVSDKTASVSVLPTETTKYKVTVKTVLDKCPAVADSVTIAVEPEIELNLSISEENICQDGTQEITLTANAQSGTPAEYIWWDGTSTSESVRIVLPTEDAVYSVQAKGAACPLSKAATANVKVDTPLEFTLTADKTLICETETNPIKLNAKITQGEAGTFSWSPNVSTVSSASVQPNKTTQYKVALKTALNKCPATEDSITITVEQAIELMLAADNYDVCQDNAQYITLTADVQLGTPVEYIWWDGETTTEPTRAILPTGNAAYSVQAKGATCPLSEVTFTDEIKVSMQTPVNLSVKTTVVNFGESAQLAAMTDQAITGPYRWYLIEEGLETLLSETNEPLFEHFPSKATAYLVKAENGACPIAASARANIKLVDATRIPTAFTPYDKDGLNDDFMPGYRVFIYDRYGNLICQSENGWDGTYRGKTADAGVYIYVVTMKDDRVERGTIEVIRLK